MSKSDITPTITPLPEAQQKFFKLANNSFKFRLFLLARLPAAFFCGLRVRDADKDRCGIIVPYKWMTKNPFRSTYFACLSMAAEMSTGILASAFIQGRKPSVSMLVVGMEARFFKKATGRTVFVCYDGEMIRKAVDDALATGDAVSVRTRSVGSDDGGEVIAEVFVTWSFKVRRMERLMTISK